MRLLLLYPRMPYPPEKGDKIRTYHQLAYLSERHDVWCACFVDDAADWQHVGDCARLCEQFEAVSLSHRRSLARGMAGMARGRSASEVFGLCPPRNHPTSFYPCSCFSPNLQLDSFGNKTRTRFPGSMK